MSAAAPASSAPDRCPRCGGAFRCGIGGPGPCACTTVTLSPAQLAALAARYPGGCLCLDCLQALARGDDVEPQAPAQMPPPALGAGAGATGGPGARGMSATSPGSDPRDPSVAAPDEWLVACLCADWCRICQDWQPEFERIASRLAGSARIMWVDIEDDEDLLGAVEVDDFPTLLVARGDEVLFFGTIRADERSIVQRLERAQQGDSHPVQDPRLQGLPQRLRASATGGRGCRGVGGAK